MVRAGVCSGGVDVGGRCHAVEGEVVHRGGRVHLGGVFVSVTSGKFDTTCRVQRWSESAPGRVRRVNNLR